MPPHSNAPTLRRRACALALPAIPLVLLLGTLVSPTDSTKNATQLQAAAAHAGRWQAAALLELLAAALFPLALAGVVQLVRRRGATLANLAAVLGVLGTLGLAAIGLRHLFIYALTATNQTTALHVLNRLDNHAGAIALPLMTAGPLALILLSAAAARARLAPRWIIVGAIAFFISDNLPIPAAEEIQALIGIATFGTLALRILRLTNDQRETTAAIEPATSPSHLQAAAKAAI